MRAHGSSPTRRLAAILGWLMLYWSAAVAFAQSPTGTETQGFLAPQPAIAPEWQSGSSTLRELEARIAELESALRREQLAAMPDGIRTAQAPQSPPTSDDAPLPEVRDPAIRSVDEQTRSTTDRDETESLIRRWIGNIQDPAIVTVQEQTRSAEPERHWFDRLSIRGYAQFRINEVPCYDEDGAPPAHLGDSSVGENQGFLIRRARLILSGDVSDHMYVYIQPDFAASVPGSADANHFTQLRDCYCDVYFDEQKVHRLRIGQSKVPYGWENLQSSSNRIPLDRNDGFNSAVKNERDLGVFYYYTPEFAQDLFKYVLEEGLKGSGNYGLLGVGLYNGQGGSFREQNDDLHLAARFTLPMQFANQQVLELGLQGYTGKYTVLTSPILPLGVEPAAAPAAIRSGYRDERIGGTLVYYPQPLGFQAEWNFGRGPVLDNTQESIGVGSLTGGYAMVMYRHETDCWGTQFPFVRYHHFDGGYKSERNAPDSLIDEWELGVEWQFNPQLELSAEYVFTDRTNTAASTTGPSYRQFDGDIIRVQFQMNY